MAKKITTLKEKRQKKIAQVKAKRRKRFFVIAIILIAIFLISWLMYTSNFFDVREIQVKGNLNVTDEFVIEKSGIKRSDSLFSLPSAKIASRVKKINWVQHAAVIKNWPNAVTIDIIERKPVAFLKTDVGTFLIDKKAFVIINLGKPGKAQQLPKIDYQAKSRVKVGSYIKSKILDNALIAYGSLYSGLQKKVVSITAKSVDELYFVADGVEIIYGKAEKMKIKNLVIKTLLKHKKEQIAAIDVRVPNKPVIRTLGR